jgi:tetratricopeptide (TPR) repeat protein
MRLLVWTWLALQAVSAQTQQARQADSAEAHVKRAAAYQQKRDYRKAIPELRRALELRPDLVEAHAMLGEALLAQGFAREAVPHLERAGYVYLHAVALLEINQLPEAIRTLLDVYARRPDDPEVLFHLGKASGALMQQAFNRLVRLHPDSPRAHELQAQSYLGQGRGDLAEPEFRAVLRTAPGLPGIHLALGRILAERGDLEAAATELRAEVELSPGNAEAAWRLGAVLVKKGQSKEALAELQRSDQLKPDMLETLVELGKAYAMENQLEQAEKTFGRMIEIDDTGDLAATAHWQLSQICRKLGKAAEAAQHLKRFRELNPQKGPAPQ